MPPENESGVYPVISISDGTVESVGWLEKGGWRIGVRSIHDVYFYYAHLSSYAEEFQKGDVIKAGQLLGYMGDTGYGKQEGTSGQFPVHLHLGIYLRNEEFAELAVNPYWFLQLSGKLPADGIPGRVRLKRRGIWKYNCGGRF